MPTLQQPWSKHFGAIQPLLRIFTLDIAQQQNKMASLDLQSPHTPAAMDPANSHVQHQHTPLVFHQDVLPA